MTRLSKQKWNILFKLDDDIDDENFSDTDDVKEPFFLKDLLSRNFHPLHDPYGLWKWEIVESVSSTPFEQADEYDHFGLIGFDFEKKFRSGRSESARPWLDLLQRLWPGNWKDQLDQMNSIIKKRKQEGQSRRMRSITPNEFWLFIGILISASPHNAGGERLWGQGENEADEFQAKGVTKPIDYGPKGLNLMSLQRFKEIKEIFPKGFEDKEAEKKGDKWYKIRLLTNGFNENRKKNIAASCKKILDESMSAWKPRTTPYGELPNISYIARKPKPIGTEFKDVACAETRKWKI